VATYVIVIVQKRQLGSRQMD